MYYWIKFFSITQLSLLLLKCMTNKDDASTVQGESEDRKETTQFFKLRFLFVSTSKTKTEVEYLHPLPKCTSSASLMEAEKK